MYGVVLWSDAKERKAVIWCEDHGDLAFCNDTLDDRGHVLDTGDLIQFDVSIERHTRLASNPVRVSSGAYEGLAESLKSLPSEGPMRVPASRSPDERCNVIPLNSVRDTNREASKTAIRTATR